MAAADQYFYSPGSEERQRANDQAAILNGSAYRAGALQASVATESASLQVVACGKTFEFKLRLNKSFVEACENAGRTFERVDPRYTSQICGKCGHRQKRRLRFVYTNAACVDM